MVGYLTPLRLPIVRIKPDNGPHEKFTNLTSPISGSCGKKYGRVIFTKSFGFSKDEEQIFRVCCLSLP